MRCSRSRRFQAAESSRTTRPARRGRTGERPLTRPAACATRRATKAPRRTSTLTTIIRPTRRYWSPRPTSAARCTRRKPSRMLQFPGSRLPCCERPQEMGLPHPTRGGRLTRSPATSDAGQASMRGNSSVGRAPAYQAGGRRFDPCFPLGRPGPVRVVVFSFTNSVENHRYPAKLPGIHAATNIDWHYLTQSHILNNISSIAPGTPGAVRQL